MLADGFWMLRAHMSHAAGQLFFAFLIIAALVFLIARCKLHPFLALTLASIAIGFQSGMKLPQIARTFQEGVGNTLGFLAVVVGLGIMLGKMLAESGGAHVIARRFTQLLSGNRLPWAMLLVSLIVGIPVFFAVGLVLLVPVVYAVARETRTPLLLLALPAVSGLSVSQGFLPPHPGPMLAIEQIGADVGKTIMIGALIGLPTALVAGPVFARFVVRRGFVASASPQGSLADSMFEQSKLPTISAPSFALTLLTILLPVFLMLLASLADLTLAAENVCRAWADFLGGPAIALLLAVLLSLYSFGYARGFSAKQILKFLEDSLAPAAGILLIVGAGGGLSKMLERGGLGATVAGLVEHTNLSPLLLGWLVAASTRLAVGSATVAITMASAMLAPVAAHTPGIHRELLVLAMGAGSLFCSHVNDSGFWLVKESFNLTVAETFKTWTVLETSIGLVGLVLVLLLGQFI
jgi:gluconate:H+ symporter, GntP family